MAPLLIPASSINVSGNGEAPKAAQYSQLRFICD